MTKPIIDVKRRLLAMPHTQQGRIFALRNRIVRCEGEGMPYRYWCPDCKATWNKLSNVFVYFEKMNEKRSREHMCDTFIPRTYTCHGFSKPDSTEQGYNDD